MSKMNLKSTLWTLAFAVAAVSCSDELEGGPNNPQEEGVDGPITYMKVSVSQDVTTRAAGGEEGDSSNDQGESGSVDEYTVNDVTIILYRDALKDDESWTIKSIPTNISSTSVLVAAGHADAEGMMSSDEKWHDWSTTVELSVDDNEAFDGKTYGIIAVANLGKSAGEALVNRIKADDDINTGGELANFLQKTAWTEADDKYSNFIMSTHNDQYGTSTKILDKVTLYASATEANPNTATVHVERLAAKIRMQAATGITNFIYTVKEGVTSGQENDEYVATVRLDNVAIVNQLSSGSYLLKRVSSELNTASTALPKEATYDILLGNELYEPNKYNYVIDPWTRGKDDDNVSKLANITPTVTTTSGQATTLTYINPFTDDAEATAEDAKVTFGDMWSSYTEADAGGVTALAGNTGFSNEAKVLLAYTMENTTDAQYSLNGYSTGAVFKATYFPKKWMATNGDYNEVIPTDVTYTDATTTEEGGETSTAATTIGLKTEGKTFYDYQGEIYKDYEAIFNAYVWGVQPKGASTIYNYKSFSSSSITNVKQEDIKAAFGEGYDDPLGYISYLKGIASTNLTEGKFKAEHAIDAWLKTKTDANYSTAGINIYKNGVCYYPYWIRHADNGDRSNMGVMEFGIVRNNIYDLAVTRITGLGYSDIESPDPGNENEDGRLYIQLQIVVKNWVLRSNSSIIL